METSRTSFVWNVPQQFNFAQDVIDRLADENRLGLLFIDKNGARRDYTFPQIADASQRYASALADAGIVRGDRVIVSLPKIPQWLFVMLALDRLGAVAIPCAEQLRAKDLLFRATHSGAVAVVAGIDNWSEAERMRAAAKTLRSFSHWRARCSAGSGCAAAPRSRSRSFSFSRR